jgi:hypothetical protein
MHGRKFLDRLDLENDMGADNEVHSISGRECQPAISHRKRHLPLDLDPANLQRARQTPVINRL